MNISLKIKNKKAAENVISSTVIYLLIAMVFFAGMMLFLWNQMNGASVWERYYSEEITKLINIAKPGDQITIDIQKATQIAKKNNVQTFIFSFDNSQNKVCVKLSPGKKTCYSYFNDVIILSPDIKLIPENNILTFTISEPKK